MDRLRVIVTGLVGLYPIGGVAWDYLQYAIGLERLGHDVYYHEDTWSWPYQPVQRTYTSDGSYSADFIGAFFAQHAPGLAERWHYNHLRDREYGMSGSAFDEVARTADLFLNVSGASMIPAALSPRCTKAFVDTDPGYNQVVYLERPSWSENIDRWCDLVDAHDVHFTYAENIDGDDCTIPDAGFEWRPTRMPVLLDLWRSVDPSPASSPWTTVMTWNNFKGPVEHQGREYHGKGHEFDKIVDLPKSYNASFEIALGGPSAPVDRLVDRGWEVVDAPAVTRTPESYRRFIGSSRGEVSVAKHIYVAMRSGWFSTRSACYLASGRPVVVQDTGFAADIPIGEGVVTFASGREALEGIQRVEEEYATHALAAEEIASACFDAEGVLGRLIRDCGIG